MGYVGQLQGDHHRRLREARQAIVGHRLRLHLRHRRHDGKLKGITPRGGGFLTITEADRQTELKGLVLSEDGTDVFTLAPEPNEVYKYRIKSDDSIPEGQQSQGQAEPAQGLRAQPTLPEPGKNDSQHQLRPAESQPRHA